MQQTPVALDRIHLDRVAFAPRSSTLHFGAGTHPELRSSPWWVYVASERLPGSVTGGTSHVEFRALTPSGRELGGEVAIVERIDDERGTRLILSGLGPMSGVER